MPTRHRRIAITETPDVKAALDALRARMGSEPISMRELLIRGAREKAREIEGEDEATVARRARFLEDLRTGRPLPYAIDEDAARAVKLTGLSDVPPLVDTP